MPIRRAVIAAALLVGLGPWPARSDVPAAPPAARPAGALRVAVFNLSFNRNAPGQLLADLEGRDVPDAEALLRDPAHRTTPGQRRQQLATVAEIIKHVRPDIVVLQEFDRDPADPDRALARFERDFLGQRRDRIPGRAGPEPVAGRHAAPIRYRHRLTGPTNTGVPSGADLNGDGVVGGAPLSRQWGEDARGYGEFPGRYGMAVLSRVPIRLERRFGDLLWRDMPGARLPTDPATGRPFYSPQALAALPLSSKDHWDVVADVGGRPLHLLIAHPTPPGFDGPEDRNGRRNADELRLWADYLTGGAAADWIVDDRGARGGLPPGRPFVILGDLNADPVEGSGIRAQIRALLAHPRVSQDPACTPMSPGAVEAAARAAARRAAQGAAGGAAPAPDAMPDGAAEPARDPAATHHLAQATLEGATRTLRLDYAIPSANLTCLGAGVFWPAAGDPLAPLIGRFGDNPPSLGNGWPASDHRLVWVDVALAPPGR